MTVETTTPNQASSTPETSTNLEKVRLWDPALRLFHWLLVICVVAAWGLGEFGPSVMTLHFYFGYAICVLLAFRLIWGFVGPKVARFSHFIYGPSTLISYLGSIFKREPSYWRGHNPLGALAAFALLGILIAQVATGLMADPDDYINVGPLASTVGYDTATWANGMHHLIATLVLLIVIAHVLAIAFYKVWKRENLIHPMITGWKWVKKDSNS
ncbi:cytochrome b/b6 domain-containing protein [uncultured Cohaesibacter sp.]|uniref:cytochrome b/b6 domain-containing protein n=1 Tax=uncultured Cohaesibacter sp. TaxID=1002546 RepID=UPI0029C84A27|nr:cytochrome b/b6 domain-containing protein [uncultured Cohaesibacter sp.]